MLVLAMYHVQCWMQAWYNYGMFCLRSRDLPRAESCLREAISLQPDHADARIALAALLWHVGASGQEGCLEFATSLLHSVVSSEPGQFLAWALLGLVYEEQKQVEDARNASSQARKAFIPALHWDTVHLQVQTTSILCPAYVVCSICCLCFVLMLDTGVKPDLQGMCSELQLELLHIFHSHSWGLQMLSHT